MFLFCSTFTNMQQQTQQYPSSSALLSCSAVDCLELKLVIRSLWNFPTRVGVNAPLAAADDADPDDAN